LSSWTKHVPGSSNGVRSNTSPFPMFEKHYCTRTINNYGESLKLQLYLPAGDVDARSPEERNSCSPQWNSANYQGGRAACGLHYSMYTIHVH